MNIAIIMSGGSGQRFGDNIPKQYQDLLGKPVINHIIDNALAAFSLDKIVVALHDFGRIYLTSTSNDKISLCGAGETRNLTLKKALDHIKASFDCKKIIILDAVRPFVTKAVIDDYISKLDDYQAVITCKKITDSLGSYDMHAVDRDRYYLLQSPEAYHFKWLYDFFDGNSSLVEVLHQLPVDTIKYLNFDFNSNIKITYPIDLTIARLLLERTDS